jgi:putative oxidoreductase
VLIELAAAGSFLLGLLSPLACTATISVMTVAGIAEHRKNGFFVFKEGYEYVLFIAGVCLALGILGPGRYSLDRTLGIDDNLDGWTGAAIALIGVVGAVAMLAACWRPERKPVAA